MKDALSIFRFLRDCAHRGERSVLITLTDITGSSSRAAGTHMAVGASGAAVGSLSGGCVEAAVVAEAMTTLATSIAKLVRFGAGSHYIDIRLPCGGGIDLLFTPDPPLAIIADAIVMLENRATVSLLLGGAGGLDFAQGAMQGWSGDAFVVTHQPDVRLIVIGHGAEVVALARLASAYNLAVTILSPDATTLDAAAPFATAVHSILTPTSTKSLPGDEHTAIVFLFHDHDWELALMKAALKSSAFYIGAMGSRRTHARRAALLAEAGIAPTEIDRIIGPIGLIQATRDPDTLALFVLAQIASLSPVQPTHDYIPMNTEKLMNSAYNSMRS